MVIKLRWKPLFFLALLVGCGFLYETGIKVVQADLKAENFKLRSYCPKLICL